MLYHLARGARLEASDAIPGARVTWNLRKPLRRSTASSYLAKKKKTCGITKRGDAKMNVKTLAIFFAGFGIGAFVARLYLKEKYEKILDMELDRVNDELEKALNDEGFESDAKEDDDSKPETVSSSLDTKMFRHEIAKQNYDAYFNVSGEEKKVHPIEEPDEPFVISGNEFITDRGHEKATLTYYISVNVLCEDNEPLDVSPSDILGDSWVSPLKESDEGVVYVRNNKMGVDYEVILDDSSAEFVKENLGFGDS